MEVGAGRNLKATLEGIWSDVNEPSGEISYGKAGGKKAVGPSCARFLSSKFLNFWLGASLVLENLVWLAGFTNRHRAKSWLSLPVGLRFWRPP
jgi:hypothetical protein